MMLLRLSKKITLNQTKKDFLYEINYFRGVAILLIVLGHMRGYVVNNFNVHLSVNAIKNNYRYFVAYEEVLITGATAFFVFISGFLFYHIFYQRGFNYKNFIKKKVQNIFIPYIIMVSLLFLLLLCNEINLHINSDFILHNLLMAGAFWYIPFIMVIFLFSPFFCCLLNVLINNKLKYYCCV